MEPLKLTPAFQNYLWGGTRLKEEFGKQCNFDRVAESWELSCHPAGLSVIANSVNKGMTLKNYLEQDWLARVGECAAQFPVFPVLVKLIDAREDLSVQVHPDDAYAAEHENGQYGKTECWYVLDCDEGATIAYGFNREMTREEFRARIQDGTLMDYVNVVPVHKGDVFFIEPGTLHAIGAGILIAEIQQNSNLTYRVYDYERRDKNGKTRDLHIEKAIAVTKTWAAPPRMKRTPTEYEGYSETVLVDCAYFTATELRLSGTAMFPESGGTSYTYLLCTEGEAVLIYDEGVIMSIEKGESIFLPANFGAYELRGQDCTILTARTLPKK